VWSDDLEGNEFYLLDERTQHYESSVRGSGTIGPGVRMRVEAVMGFGGVHLLLHVSGECYGTFSYASN
jgi:hypothetical protein